MMRVAYEELDAGALVNALKSSGSVEIHVMKKHAPVLVKLVQLVDKTKLWRNNRPGILAKTSLFLESIILGLRVLIFHSSLAEVVSVLLKMDTDHVCALERDGSAVLRVQAR